MSTGDQQTTIKEILCLAFIIKYGWKYDTLYE